MNQIVKHKKIMILIDNKTEPNAFDTKVNEFLANVSPNNIVTVSTNVSIQGSGTYYYYFVTYKHNII